MSTTINRVAIVAFCILSLGLTFALGAWLYPHATLSAAEVETARTAAPMEEFDLFDLGDDYGELTIFDLIGFYIDNPPAPESNAPTSKKKHFGGC